MTNKKCFVMINCVIFLICLFHYELNGGLISDILKTIPAEERQDIEDLFHYLFLQQDGCYTIFGDKPVSCAATFLIPHWKSILKGYPSKFYKTWKVWQKHRNKFPIKNYTIVSERCSSKRRGSVAFYVYVIDKRRFILVLNQHKALFENILHERINPENFLADIEAEKRTLLTSIHHNEMLFGLILGYGKHNAFLYEELNLRRKAPFSRREKAKLNCTQQYYPMMLINPVQFKADLNHPESMMLQKKYENLHKKISNIFSSGNFLEIILFQLIL